MVGNRTVRRYLQREAEQAGAKTEQLKDQKVGVMGDEPALIAPDDGKLTDTWGDAETPYGGDSEVARCVESALTRFSTRSAAGQAQGSPDAAKLLTAESMQAEYRLMVRYHSEGEYPAPRRQIPKLKREWLSVLPSRIDMACTAQPGIVHQWDMNPYKVTSPTAEEKQPIPASVPLMSGSIRMASDAMVAFIGALEPLAVRKGLHFGVQNRQPHSNGWGADFYLVTTNPKTGASTSVAEATEPATGFWDPDRAASFLMLFGDAAAEAGVDWHVIYNDPRVGRAVNLFYKNKGDKKSMKAKVVFGGSYRDRRGDIERNFHGPIVLHFHVDILWPASHVRPTPHAPTPQLAPKP